MDCGDFQEDQCNYYMSKICSKCGGNHKSYQCKEIEDLKCDHGKTLDVPCEDCYKAAFNYLINHSPKTIIGEN